MGQKYKGTWLLLREDNTYHLWYTGYTHTSETKYLGYATSPDGLTWTRYNSNPIYTGGWVEDMCVVKSDNVYYMFAEGRGDTAHMLTSRDRIHWTAQGNLDIYRVDGNPISKGSFGTPSVLKEKKYGIFFMSGKTLVSGLLHQKI